MKKVRNELRNVAIIAHVDHGKTTLVDAMLRQSGIFRSNERLVERVMDSGDLEREKGITIMSKNTSVVHNGTRINIVDTPGHADFGGEVERILKMVDGVLLLVDAYEGAMPQTRFVLRKALALQLKPIVVINKIDRKDARPAEVIDEILDLFIELGADDDLLDFPVIYTSAKNHIAKYDLDDESDNLDPLFETIKKHIPAPIGDSEAPLQFLVSSLDYDDYIGRIAIGRIERGTVNKDQQAVICKKNDSLKPVKISSLQNFQGLKRVDVDSASVGEIIAVSGIPDITIGDTICDADYPEAIPFVEIDEPTISMYFLVNNSPFAGKEGTYVTSRHIRNRLFREVETNVSMRVEETDSPDAFKVSGRGELHLSILIETMRREGYEFQVSKPEVITIERNGVIYEPIENLVIDVPEEYLGNVMEKLGQRKAELINMHGPSQGYVRLDYRIPARSLIGYRSEFLTDTRGNGIMNHVFYGYEPFKGEIKRRNRGVLVAWEAGESVTYGLYNAQDRGSLFIGPGVQVYEGMIVGMCSRNEDIVINVCKKKHVTNIRASGSDEALKLVPHINMSLEQSLEFIDDDELVEITPKSIRLRKKILNTEQRAKVRKDAKR
ncbi:MAG TPA: translational GTPase TypA [Clostridiaceae bacterium]|nr:translational GTPase TypA [Clostridiaceae bacterium]